MGRDRQPDRGAAGGEGNEERIKGGEKVGPHGKIKMEEGKIYISAEMIIDGKIHINFIIIDQREIDRQHFEESWKSELGMKIRELLRTSRCTYNMKKVPRDERYKDPE
jgi:hypothetical protein